MRIFIPALFFMALLADSSRADHQSPSSFYCTHDNKIAKNFPKTIFGPVITTVWGKSCDTGRTPPSQICSMEVRCIFLTDALRNGLKNAKDPLGREKILANAEPSAWIPSHVTCNANPRLPGHLSPGPTCPHPEDCKSETGLPTTVAKVAEIRTQATEKSATPENARKGN
jgi:hypothetical protein